jgi:hypothetical protein
MVEYGLFDKLPNGKPVLEAAQFAYMGLAYNILTPAKAISKATYAVKVDWLLRKEFLKSWKLKIQSR